MSTCPAALCSLPSGREFLFPKKGEQAGRSEDSYHRWSEIEESKNVQWLPASQIENCTLQFIFVVKTIH